MPELTTHPRCGGLLDNRISAESARNLTAVLADSRLTFISTQGMVFLSCLPRLARSIFYSNAQLQACRHANRQRQPRGRRTFWLGSSWHTYVLVSILASHVLARLCTALDDACKLLYSGQRGRVSLARALELAVRNEQRLCAGSFSYDAALQLNLPCLLFLLACLRACVLDPEVAHPSLEWRRTLAALGWWNEANHARFPAPIRAIIGTLLIVARSANAQTRAHSQNFCHTSTLSLYTMFRWIGTLNYFEAAAQESRWRCTLS